MNTSKETSPTFNDLIENAQTLNFEMSRLFNAMTTIRDYEKNDVAMPDVVFHTLTEKFSEKQEALNELLWHIWIGLGDE